MKPGARIAAAIEILDEILSRHQPVSIALADWGKGHRFAGSGDRNAIGHMVYDALRHKASSAYFMASETSRALVLGALRERGLSLSDIGEMCSGQDHAATPLTDDELKRLELASTVGAPDWVSGNYPEWLQPSFDRAFGIRAVEEGKALSRRAPADIRVNTLKATRERALKALASFGAVETTFSPIGIRVPAPIGDARTPNLEAEAAFQAGWCEIQDEGSQIAAALTGAGPRMQILDLCAGAGGKTLALSAAMQNTGQVYAYDDDKHRLKPIFARVKRAGVRNVQILRGGDEAALDALGAKFDVVLADAPCTGAGTWRRRPDAKWRLRPHALSERIKDQQSVLARAVKMVRPGGRLVYVTCSILPEENSDQIAACLAANTDFRAVPFADAWRATLPGEPPVSADGSSEHLVLTPAQHGTDGFFIAVLERVQWPAAVPPAGTLKS
jgi:16S rRNA (cytosine967-C5)-methyltransferase